MFQEEGRGGHATAQTCPAPPVRASSCSGRCSPRGAGARYRGRWAQQRLWCVPDSTPGDVGQLRAQVPAQRVHGLRQPTVATGPNKTTHHLGDRLGLAVGTRPAHGSQTCVPCAEQPTGSRQPAEATAAGRPDSVEPVGEGHRPSCGTVPKEQSRFTARRSRSGRHLPCSRCRHSTNALSSAWDGPGPRRGGRGQEHVHGPL